MKRFFVISLLILTGHFFSPLLAGAVPVPVETSVVGSGLERLLVKTAAQREQDEALKAKQQGKILPFGKIKARAEKALSGQLVGERLSHSNRGWVYEVRVRQKDGRVVFGRFDASNGRLLSSSGGKK